MITFILFALAFSVIILLILSHYFGGFRNMCRYAPQQLVGLSVAVFGSSIPTAIAIHGAWMLHWGRNQSGNVLSVGMVFIVIGTAIFLNASLKKD